MPKKATKQHAIVLSSGSGRKISGPLRFSYSSSEFLLILRENGFRAKYVQKTISKEIGFDQKKQEIVKKALLLYLIETGKCRKFYDVSLIADGVRKEKRRFYFLEGVNGRQLGEDSRTKLQQIVLNKTRSNYPPSVTCFINYALGGAKKDSEAFRYLYQGFNTFCSNFVVSSKSPGKSENKGHQSDAEGIKKIRDKFYLNPIPWLPPAKFRPGLCKNIDFANKECALQEVNRRIGRLKEKRHPINDLSPFILLVYSYYLRCKFFHGETSFPLVSTEGDAELSGFAVCSEELSSFLKEHIHELINQDYTVLLKKELKQ